MPRASTLAATVTILMAVGCAAPRPATQPTASAAAPLAGENDCATRLHEICGALLLYYNIHRDLPPIVDVLERSPGAENVGEMTCPASGKPYVYVPGGVPIAPAPSRVVLYDAEPSHAGKRLAVTIQPPQGDGPLIAKVIAVPESQAAALSLRPTTQP